jgi:hypothetical protein
MAILEKVSREHASMDLDDSQSDIGLIAEIDIELFADSLQEDT